MSAKLAPSFDPRFVERDDDALKIFDVRPTQSLINELLDFTRKEGTPDLWRWHLHTKPRPGSRFVIVAEDVTVPESMRPRVGMAPCPQCSLHAGKYFAGMLAWFPDEKAVRVIGNECAKHVAGAQALTDARQEFKAFQADERATNFLIENLSNVRVALGTLDALARRARTLDRVAKAIRGALLETTRREILDNQSRHDGLPLLGTVMVPVLDRRGQPVLDAKGDILRQEDEVVVAVLPVQGLKVFGAQQLCESYAVRAADALTGLSVDDDDHALALIERLGQAGRIDAEKRIRDAWKLIAGALALFSRMQSFTKPDNINRLGAWGSDHRATLKLHAVASTTGRFEIGEVGRKAVTIFPVGEVNDPLPTLPDLA